MNLLVCIVLVTLALKKKEKDSGIVLAGYGILYSIGRFFIEGLRTDSFNGFWFKNSSNSKCNINNTWNNINSMDKKKKVHY